MTRKPLFGPAPRLEILGGVSFDVARGAVLGIGAARASGKTTLGARWCADRAVGRQHPLRRPGHHASR
jgi:ABC-type dipeptide/oligopeptide/nickel transport system ATPase subunit